MCLLFLIILALLQFRVIQDSYLLSLCYGILLAATIVCVMSMPALNKICPLDTKEVSNTAILLLVKYYLTTITSFIFRYTGFNRRCLASYVCSVRYLCADAAANLGGNSIWHFIAYNSHRFINISNADRTASLL